MSNCIDIKNGSVTFLDSEINLSEFRSFLNSVTEQDKDADENCCYSDKGFAWWFLLKNSTFYRDRVIIEFGEGNSIHTFRDFKQTLRVIAKYMKKEKLYSFIVRDAENRDPWGTWLIDIKNPDIEHKVPKLKTVKKFDKYLVDQTKRKILELLQNIGMTVNIEGMIRYSPSNMKIKLVFSLPDESGEAVTPERAEFITHCTSFGMKPEDFGKEIVYRGEKFILCGLKMRRRKFPILVKRVKDGKMFCLPPEIR